MIQSPLAVVALAEGNGPLRRGDGGFNAPWTWHLDPAETRFVEVAIEICDGRPSYVEAHQPDFPRYCPGAPTWWGDASHHHADLPAEVAS